MSALNEPRDVFNIIKYVVYLRAGRGTMPGTHTRAAGRSTNQRFPNVVGALQSMDATSLSLVHPSAAACRSTPCVSTSRTNCCESGGRWGCVSALCVRFDMAVVQLFLGRACVGATCELIAITGACFGPGRSSRGIHEFRHPQRAAARPHSVGWATGRVKHEAHLLSWLLSTDDFFLVHTDYRMTENDF